LSSNFSLDIDPCDVLGVSREATLQEIRDAYRAKSKRYHPDAGGEEWTFRILVQAYEILSTARVVRATQRESSRPAPATPPPPPPPRRSTVRSPADSGETVRPGVRERAVDPSRVVDVEKLTIRYEAEHVWLITESASEQRILSCCLNITWPDPGLGVPPTTIPNAEEILRGLGELFDALCVQSRVQSSRSAVVDGRFTGWVSYTNLDRVSAAFTLYREMLHTIGLVVSQWSRDLVIPRHWR